MRFQSLGQRRRRIHEAGGVVPGRGNTTGYFIIFATCSHVNTLSFGLLDLSVVFEPGSTRNTEGVVVCEDTGRMYMVWRFCTSIFFDASRAAIQLLILRSLNNCQTISVVRMQFPC